jgi:hypothetical protein
MRKPPKRGGDSWGICPFSILKLFVFPAESNNPMTRTSDLISRYMMTLKMEPHVRRMEEQRDKRGGASFLVTQLHNAL